MKLAELIKRLKEIELMIGNNIPVMIIKAGEELNIMNIVNYGEMVAIISEEE